MRAIRLWWCCLGLCCCITTVNAQPLPVRDLNPLLSGYELPPALPDTPPERTTLSAEFAVGNISLDQGASSRVARLSPQGEHTTDESLQLDGEHQRWQFSFAKPLSDTLGLRIELPYVRLSGGHLDNFIESFHQTFGMPNGNRDLWPSKRLWIQHARDGQSDYSLSDAQDGIGDLTLRLGKRLGKRLGTHPKFNNTLWVSLKLPTGNAQDLTGSDSVDMAISLASSQRLSPRFVTHQQLSMSLLGHGERLSAQQKNAVWSGSLSVDANVTRHWSAVMQLDGHTQVFSTDLRALGPALQLSFGPRYQSGAWRSEFIISEDIAVDRSPDVQFQLGITRAW